jgi:hypothetical protein
MKKISATINPYLSSASYLSLEAQKQGLQQVSQIFQSTEQQLSKHIIDELLLSTPSTDKIEISKEDLYDISQILIGISRLSTKALRELSRMLDEEEANQKHN